MRLNRWRPAQSAKYWILTFLLAVSALELALDFLRLPATHTWLAGIMVAAGLLFSTIYAPARRKVSLKKTLLIFLSAVVSWFLVSNLLRENHSSAAALQIGLLDPIPLVYRSFNLIVLPLLDHTTLKLSGLERLYDGTWLMAAVFLTAILLNLLIPRFVHVQGVIEFSPN